MVGSWWHQWLPQFAALSYLLCLLCVNSNRIFFTGDELLNIRQLMPDNILLWATKSQSQLLCMDKHSWPINLTVILKTDRIKHSWYWFRYWWEMKQIREQLVNATKFKLKASWTPKHDATFVWHISVREHDDSSPFKEIFMSWYWWCFCVRTSVHVSNVTC